MRLVPLSAGVLSILFLAVLLFLLLSGYLLYPPIRELFPVWQDFLLRMPLLSDWIPSSLLGQLTRMMPSVFSWLFGIFLYFVSLLLFARDWKAFDAMLSKLPFYQMVRNAGSRMATACQNWIHAQIRIMFVITLECAAGYWLLLHLPGAGLWGRAHRFSGCASGLRHWDRISPLDSRGTAPAAFPCLPEAFHPLRHHLAHP